MVQKKTQNQKILEKMYKHKDKWFRPSDFMKPWYFVWYSAGARLSTILKLWLVEKRPYNWKWNTLKSFREYKINERGIAHVEQWNIYLRNPYEWKNI